MENGIGKKKRKLKVKESITEHKTKTYRYLFFPVICLYLSKSIIEAFFSLDIYNIYLEDKAIKKYYKKVRVKNEVEVKTVNSSMNDDYIYIVLNTSKANTKEFETIQNSVFYRGCYIIPKEDGFPSEYFAVVWKIFSGRPFKHFLNSDYSQMYSKEFLEDKKDLIVKSFLLENSFRVLYASEEDKKAIVKNLSLDSSLVEGIKEIDSVLKEKDETFNSNTFIKNINNETGSSNTGQLLLY